MVPFKHKSTFKHENDFSDFLNADHLKSDPTGKPRDQAVLQEYIKLRNSFMLKSVLGLKMNFNICSSGTLTKLSKKAVKDITP